MKKTMKRMVSDAWCLVLGALCLALGAGSAMAATTTFKGQTITYTGSSVEVAGDDTNARILIFKTSNDTTGSDNTLSFDTCSATADILVVGGGGSGSSLTSGSGYYGAGGKAQESKGVAMPIGSYSISVGAGGASVTAWYQSASGNDGGNSSISGPPGFTTLSQNGGAGGTTTRDSTGGSELTSSISGQSLTYGVDNGASNSTSNRGNGGAGGAGARRASTAGNAGVVIVRITAVKPAEAERVVLVRNGSTPFTTTAVTGGTLKDDYSTALVEVSYAPTTGALSIAPKQNQTGSTAVTIETDEKDYVYQVSVVTLTSSLTLKVGEGKQVTMGGAGSLQADWTETPGDGRVCEVKDFSPDRASTKTVGISGKAPGYTVWMFSKGTTENYTYGITVTNAVSGELNLDFDETHTTLEVACETVTGAAWSGKSSNEDVLTVDVSGSEPKTTAVLTAKKTGEATVTIWNAYITYTYKVTVRQMFYDSWTADIDTPAHGGHDIERQVTCTDAGSGTWYAMSSNPDSVIVDGISAGMTDETITPTITAIAVGSATVIIQKSKYVVHKYDVTVVKYHSDLANEYQWTYGTETANIGYENAIVNEVDGDLVLIFTNITPKDVSKTIPSYFELPSPKNFRVDVLAVGGGGAGGSQGTKNNGGGGGGAGGYAMITNSLLTGGMYTVEVGRGGRRADFGPAIGDRGLPSIVTNNLDGGIVASAIYGGGGGASIDVTTGGDSGGSGGGGAWVGGVSTAGGAGVGGGNRDGQGNRGGTPAEFLKGTTTPNYNNGGGGGGACSETNEFGVILGEGGAWGEPGAGIANDITGETLTYAQGGAGGKKTTTAAAKDGAGYGWGGDGGNGGVGGGGGDGVVVVRLRRMFENIKIQHPSVFNGGLAKDASSTNNYSEFVCDMTQLSPGHPVGPFTSFNLESNVLDRAGNPISDGKGGYLRYCDVTNHVSGCWTTNVNIGVNAEGNVCTNGLGHHQYTIFLKEGVAWENDTAYGSANGYLIDWRITDDFDKIDATIKVTKNVEWDDDGGSNATIRITSHSTPAQNPIVPKVLFIGTGCRAHSLTTDTVFQSLNTIAKNASVDWYVFTSDSNNQAGNSVDGKLKEHTTLSSGDIGKIEGIFKNSGAHSALHGFMKQVALAIDVAHTNYDYVVLEFDGSRVATDYSQVDTNERTVAERLEWYYENERVILVTDHCNANGTEGKTTEAFGWKGEVGKSELEYYRPNTFLASYSDTRGGRMTDFTSYRGLLALTSPKTYFYAVTNDISSFEALSADTVPQEFRAEERSHYYRVRDNNFTTTNFYANARYPVQEYYDNVTNLTAFLNATIKPVAYNIRFSDQVLEGVGLTITDVDFSIATNEVEQGSSEGWLQMAVWTNNYTGVSMPEDYHYDGFEYWKDKIPGLGQIQFNVTEVSTSSNQVSLTMTNMLIETWAKIDIHVVDDGGFKTSVNATYNPATGQWEKNPNKGEAKVAMVDGAGKETEVKGEAATSTSWSFNVWPLSGDVKNGYVMMNGLTNGWRQLEYDADEQRFSRYQNTISFCEGYKPVVAYPGFPGYSLVSLTVNGSLKEINETNEVYYILKDGLISDVSIVARHESYVERIESEPATNVYDGAGHVFPVQVKLTDGITYSNEVRYALLKDGVQLGECTNVVDFLAQYGSQIKDVGTYSLVYEVWALQPGYGETYKDTGWVEIGSAAMVHVGNGTNTVTVLPKELTITPNEVQVAHAGDPAVLQGYAITGFIDGEDERNITTNGLYVATDYTTDKPIGQYSLWIEDPQNRLSPATNGNYIIVKDTGTLSVSKGPFKVNEVPQGPGTHVPDDPLDLSGRNGVTNVVIIYNGEGTNITVNVTDPDDPAKYRILYKNGDNGVWTNQADNLPPFEFRHAGTNKVYYAIEPVDGAPYFAATNQAWVTILPCPLLFESASAERRYDPFEDLATNSVKVTVGDREPFVVASPVRGTKLDAAFGLADDGCTFTVTGNRGAVGVSTNDFTYKLWRLAGLEETHAEDYDITCKFGTLTVKPAGFIVWDPNDPSGSAEYPADPEETEWLPVETNGVLDVVKEYDGLGTNILVNVIFPAGGAGCEILYTTNNDYTSSEVWVRDLQLTNVCNVGVYFKITDKFGNFTPAINIAYVTITQRVATVTAGSDSKTYDGQPLTNVTFTTERFVAGEGIEFVTMTPDSAITHVGTTNNVIATLYPSNTTDLANYLIVTNAGTLAVTPRSVRLWSDDQRGEFSDKPAEMPGTTNRLDVLPAHVHQEGIVEGELFDISGFGFIDHAGDAPASFEYAGSATADTNDYEIAYDPGNLILGQGEIYIGNKRVPKDPKSEDKWPDPDPDPAKDKTGVRPVKVPYDGNPTSITVTVSYPSASENVKCHVMYRLEDETEWRPELPMFTTVTNEVKVHYRVEIEGKTPGQMNYNAITNYSYVTIDPREVTVTANDVSIAYDEVDDRPKPPEVKGFEIDNPVPASVGDVFDVLLDYTNETFTVGEYPEAIVTSAVIRVLNEKTDIYPGGDATPNYLILFEPGDLYVNNSDIKAEADAPVKMWDGEPTNVTITVTEPTGAELDILVSTNGTNWVEPKLLTFTDAGTYDVQWKVVDHDHPDGGGYKTKTGTTKVTILHKPIIVKANDQTKASGDTGTIYTWTACESNEMMTFVADLELPAETITNLTKLGIVSVRCEKDGAAPGFYRASIEASMIVPYVGNYEVVKFIPGDLMVTENPRKPYELRDPFDGKVYEQWAADQESEHHKTNGENDNAYNNVKNVVKIYDGEPTNIVIDIVKPENGDGVTIWYRNGDDGMWTSDKAQFEQGLVGVGTNKVWYMLKYKTVPEGEISYETISNYAYVTVLPATLTVTAEDKEIRYATPAPGLAAADGFYTSRITGFVKDEEKQLGSIVRGRDQIEYACDYEQYVTKADETPAIDFAEKTLTADNYVFTYVPGELTVTKGEIQHAVDIPTHEYDGTGTNITVTVKEPTDKGNDFKQKYVVDGGEPTDMPPVFTNAGTYTVTYIIEDGDNYDWITNTVEMTITPRPITLTSGDQKRQYNGQALKTNVEFDQIAIGGSGYVGNERFTYVAGEGITKVGTAKASFTCTDGTALVSNYDVKTVFGTLEVTPSEDQVVVYSNDGSWTFNGLGHGYGTPGEKNVGYHVANEDKIAADDILVVTLAGNEVTNVTDKADNAVLVAKIMRGDEDVTGQYAGFSVVTGKLSITAARIETPDIEKENPPTDKPWVAATNVVQKYDGTNVHITVAYGNFYNEKHESIAPTITYSLTKDGEYGDNIDFLDVTNQVVWYAVSAENYIGCTNKATVTITPRSVKFVSSQDDKKSYGGTYPTDPDAITVADDCDGFVVNQDGNEEGVNQFTNLGSYSEVGKHAAEYDVELNAFTKEINYAIEKTYGSISISKDEALVFTAASTNFVFNGQVQTNWVWELTSGKLKTDHTPEIKFSPESKMLYPTDGKDGVVTNHIDSVIIRKGGQDVTKEYESVQVQDGQLTMSTIKMPPVTSYGTNTTYDARNYTITVEKPDLLSTPRIGYSTNKDGPFTAEKPMEYADAGTYTVYYEVTAPGYDPVRGSEQVLISKFLVTLTSGTYTNVYDGTVQSNNVVTCKPESLIGDDEVVAWTTSGLRDVGETSNMFEYYITNRTTHAEDPAKNYFVTNILGNIVITPYYVKVGYGAASKTYDGETNTSYTANSATFNPDTDMTKGIPTGESFSFDPTGMTFFFRDPNVGTDKPVDAYGFVATNNVKWAGSPSDVERYANYRFTFVPTTTAEIFTKEPPDLDPDPKDPSNPRPPEAGPHYGPRGPEDPLPDLPQPTNRTDGTWSQLSDYDVVTNYDGKAHTFNEELLKAALAATNLVNTLYSNNLPKIRYSLDGVDWSATKPFAWTDTVVTSFWYKVETDLDGNQNYSNYIHAVGVTILPAKMVVKADDKTLTYGDAVPAADFYTYSFTNEFQNGELAKDVITESTLAYGSMYKQYDARDWGAGLHPKVIITRTGELKARNYVFEYLPGDLTILKAKIRHSVDVPDVPYDGRGTNITVTVDEPGDKGNTFTKKYLQPDGTYTTDLPVYTNAGTYTVTYVIEDGDDFDWVTNTVTFTIRKRRITLTSGDLSKLWDGEELRMSEEITPGGEGYAPGECFAYTCLGKRTDVGRSPSNFTYANGTALLMNYDVDVIEGELEVEPSDEQIAVYSKDGKWTYDGDEHGYDPSFKPSSPDCGYRIVHGDLLKDGDTLEVVLAGTKVTNVCSGVDNAFKGVKIKRGEADVTAEYENLVVVTGKLAVAVAEIRTPDIENEVPPADEPWVGATNVVKVYDGIATNIQVVWDNFRSAGGGPLKPTITYSLTKDGEYGDNFDFLDVTNQTVWYAVSAPNYVSVTNCATVKITPRRLVFRSSQKTIDVAGTEHKTVVDKETIKLDDVSADDYGFVGEEGLLDDTPYTSQTAVKDVGSWSALYGLNPKGNTKLGNYSAIKLPGEIDLYPENGLLFVAGSTNFTFNGMTQTNWTYDVYGTVHEGDVTNAGFKASSKMKYPGDKDPDTGVEGIVSNRFDWVQVLDKDGNDAKSEYSAIVCQNGALTMSPAKLEGIVSHGTNTLYDGTAYSITVDTNSVKDVPGLTVGYSADPNGPFVSALTFTDAGEYTVHYEVTAPGYETVSGSDKVVIRRIDVLLRSLDLDPVPEYDGKGHIYDKGVCSMLGGAEKDWKNFSLTNGDYVLAWTISSQTNAGSCANQFQYVITNAAAKAGADLAKNYNVTVSNGTLKVERRPVTLDFTVVNPKVYNGDTNATYVSSTFTLKDGGTWPTDGTEGFKFDPTVRNLEFCFTNAAVGASKDVFVVGDWLACVSGTNSVTKKGNYKITINNPEQSEIIKAGPPPLDPDDPDDPQFPPEAGPYFDPNAGPWTPPSPKDPDDESQIRKLSNYDIVTVYDGQGHTFDYDSLTNSIATNVWLQAGYKVQYSLDGARGSWQDEPFVWTNVVSTSFWYNVEAPFGAPNYSNYIHAVGVTITNRHVLIETGSTNFTYNGHAQAYTNLTAETATAEEIAAGTKLTGFVPGEYLAVTGDWATITDRYLADGVTLNEVTNTFSAAEDFATSVQLNESYGSTIANYFITVSNGLLHVDAAQADDDLIEMEDLDRDGLPKRYYNAYAYELEPVVSNVVLEAELVKDKDFTYDWEDVIDATQKLAKVIVTFEGNYEGVLTNLFTICPRTVELWSASETRPYSGEAWSNMTVTSTVYRVTDDAGKNKPDYIGQGFVPGEGVSTNGFVDILNVGMRANTFTCALLPGTKAQNYVLPIVCNPGTLEVIPSPSPLGDKGPDEDRGPFTEDPEKYPPLPTDFADGLSDFDVITNYDGEAHTFDTNALYYALSTNELFAGNNPTVTYSLDGTTWTEGDTPYFFTNKVVTSFWYKVTTEVPSGGATPNYSNYIHAVGVTILPRPITITAANQRMTYEDLDSFDPGLDVPQAWGPHEPSAVANTNLVAGHDVAFVNLWLKEDASHYDPSIQPEWSGAIVTSKVHCAEKPYFIISNATEDVTSNYEIFFVPGDLAVDENLALFKATLKWMYFHGGGDFLAQVTVVNTNKTDSFKFTPGSLRYCFADRGDDAFLYDPIHKVRLAKTEVHDGVTYRAFYLADPGTGERGGWSKDMTKVYGPEDGVSYSAPLLVLLGKDTPTMSTSDRVAPLHDAFLGWLVWESDGITNSIPLVADEEKVREANRVMSAPVHSIPSLMKMNMAAACKVSYAEGSDPTCRIGSFEIAEGRIYGTIVTMSGDGKSTGVPAASATVELFGTDNLANGVRNLGTIETDPQGGFSLNCPDGIRFFTVRIGIGTETFK